MSTSDDSELNAFYRVIAQYYDKDYAGLLGERDINFYLDLARESGGPVLEMGCGTGRVLLPIARSRIPVYGLDGSAEMLEQLRVRMRSEAAEVRDGVVLIHGDIRSADVGRRFPLITAPGNVLHSFPDRRDQRAWLSNVRRHLTPGGALCFDVFQFDYRRLVASDDWAVDVDRVDAETGRRVRRFSRCRHEPEFQRFRIEMRWLTEDSEGATVSEHSAAVMQRWFTRGELENLLELEGFRITDYWGSFAREPFGVGSPEQVIRAVVDSEE